ncbi:MAG: type III toxin-antitoxin system ToxN/AbiQ family toxin [Fusobacteriaceae bacterium]|nr:type III toxin-antitoxin system ToxN/AbiQ family toxin [Fusobacteriaceae bacterium]
MILVKLADGYLDYLAKYDKKVPQNKNEKRPYVGILFEIGEIKYFAPLTSPKLKHEKMRETLDFVKIEGGKLGAINLNNMIPVNKIAIIEYNINKLKLLGDSMYPLLNNQMRYINKNSKRIRDRATKLYYEVNSGKVNPIIERCCNFKLLEEKAILYMKKQNV